MGLYACKECRREVSDKAVACQHCGCPTASKAVWRSLSELNTPVTWVFLLIATLVIYLLTNANDFFAADEVSNLSGKLSHLGDFFGGILTPLLTFISVILLIATLKLTRDSVDISKRELMLSRQAMSESAVALKNQAQSLEVQNFNSLFFNLLSYHERTLSSLTFESTYGAEKYIGRDCLEVV